jgi:hypothetical protein
VARHEGAAGADQGLGIHLDAGNLIGQPATGGSQEKQAVDPGGEKGPFTAGGIEDRVLGVPDRPARQGLGEHGGGIIGPQGCGGFHPLSPSVRAIPAEEEIGVSGFRLERE